MPPSNEVLDLRDLIGMSRTEFAAILGVDNRTVSRWEDGSSEPSGTARAVLSAFREVLTRRHPDDAQIVRETLRSSANVGGLGYLLVHLLDAWTNACATHPAPAPDPSPDLSSMAEALQAVRAERDTLERTLTAERAGLTEEIREMQKLLGITRKTT